MAKILNKEMQVEIREHAAEIATVSLDGYISQLVEMDGMLFTASMAIREYQPVEYCAVHYSDIAECLVEPRSYLRKAVTLFRGRQELQLTRGHYNDRQIK